MACVVVAAMWLFGTWKPIRYRGFPLTLGIQEGRVYSRLWRLEGDTTKAAEFERLWPELACQLDYRLPRSETPFASLLPAWHRRQIVANASSENSWVYHTTVAIPFGLPLSLTALVTLWLWSRDRRIPPGRCQNCRYDLTGNVSGRCPECGETA